MGGVPAHYITKIEDFAEKCLRETPDYDMVEFEINKLISVKKMIGWKMKPEETELGK